MQDSFTDCRHEFSDKEPITWVVVPDALFESCALVIVRVNGYSGSELDWAKRKPARNRSATRSACLTIDYSRGLLVEPQHVSSGIGEAGGDLGCIGAYGLHDLASAATTDFIVASTLLSAARTSPKGGTSVAQHVSAGKNGISIIPSPL